MFMICKDDKKKTKGTEKYIYIINDLINYYAFFFFIFTLYKTTKDL